MNNKTNGNLPKFILIFLVFNFLFTAGSILFMVKQVNDVSEQACQAEKTAIEVKVELMLWRYSGKHVEINVKEKVNE